jgi:hypothetical protein
MIQMIEDTKAPFVRSLSVIKRPTAPNGYARSVGADARPAPPAQAAAA